MKFKMIHENYNVYDLGRSMEFYEKALGLKEVRRIPLRTVPSSSSTWLTRRATSSWS